MRGAFRAAVVGLLSLVALLQTLLLLRGHSCLDKGSNKSASPKKPPPKKPSEKAGSNKSTTSSALPCVVNQSCTLATRWAVEDERMKSGAGLLFFAYGGKQLSHFLGEARRAAATFRQHNPTLQIAIVSNAESVDNATFDFHIKPRPDLLFAGSQDDQQRGDHLPRQWLTRLYYLAHSPFHITWALDSNVVACTPHAAGAFLNRALRADLWGYDIAHANQRDGPMLPHNFNLIYKWSAVTSTLMRDWLLLQLRRGVAADDQKTLHFAEMRQIASGGLGLSVGQLTTEFAAAMYEANTLAAAPPADEARIRLRISRVLRGPAHVLHAKSVAECSIWNEHAYEPRQILQVGHKRKVDSRSTFSHRTLFSLDECERAMAGGGVVAAAGTLPPNVTASPPAGALTTPVEHGKGDGAAVAAAAGSSTATRRDGATTLRARCPFYDVSARVTPQLHRALLAAECDRVDASSDTQRRIAKALAKPLAKTTKDAPTWPGSDNNLGGNWSKARCKLPAEQQWREHAGEERLYKIDHLLKVPNPFGPPNSSQAALVPIFSQLREALNETKFFGDLLSF